jgi:hypothetical protein
VASVLVDGRRFIFPDSWKAEKYDDWSYYRNRFQSVCGGTKAVDLIALEGSKCCWLIEFKNYRSHRRTKPSRIPEEIAAKVRDTLAGLFAAQSNATDAAEKAFAKSAVRCRHLRIAFYLEQPTKPSKLFPHAIEPANVLQRLKQLLKPIDPHPLLVEATSTPHIPWIVEAE